jgi:hypothetical protein
MEGVSHTYAVANPRRGREAALSRVAAGRPLAALGRWRLAGWRTWASARNLGAFAIAAFVLIQARVWRRMPLAADWHERIMSPFPIRLSAVYPTYSRGRSRRRRGWR